jgi:hypothetical protein
VSPASLADLLADDTVHGYVRVRYSLSPTNGMLGDISWLEPEDRARSRADHVAIEAAMSKAQKPELLALLEREGWFVHVGATRKDLRRMAATALYNLWWPERTVGAVPTGTRSRYAHRCKGYIDDGAGGRVRPPTMTIEAYRAKMTVGL